MRTFYLIFLLVFTGAAAVLAYENQQAVTLSLFGTIYDTNVPILVALSYAAGMLSGWTMVGIIRRSLNQATRNPFPGEYSTPR